MSRARQPEQKQERRRAILEAAADLWTHTTYDSFTMAELAHRLGLAKGTLYLYFETKEQLFIVVLEQMLEVWLAELARAYQSLNPVASPRQISTVMYETLRDRYPMIRLFPLMHHLAGNAFDEHEMAAFDRRILSYLTPVAQALETCLPTLRPGWGFRFMLHSRAVTIGTFQRADKPEIARKVASEYPDLRGFDITFEREFLFATEALVRGFVDMSKDSSVAY